MLIMETSSELPVSLGGWEEVVHTDLPCHGFACFDYSFFCNEIFSIANTRFPDVLSDFTSGLDR